MSENQIDTASRKLPEPLRDKFKFHWQRWLDNDTSLAGCSDNVCKSLPRVWSCSDFVTQFCLRNPEIFLELVGSGQLERQIQPQTIEDALVANLSNIDSEAALKVTLRRFRNLQMMCIAWRDLAGWADLDEVLRAMSALADACIRGTVDWLVSASRAEGEVPLNEDGSVMPLVVIAMGKLGGFELNFSSDVDLIFSYSAEGDIQGKKISSHHEFFTRFGKRLIAILNDVTEDGFVFRVDMRLRPNGKSGALVLSFDAMENYYQTYGREWERYAWIKARTVNKSDGDLLLQQLRPFVYRRYIDFGAVESIREMKALITQELKRKGVENNIKLGPGGIREIEFIGQAFQLIRGGREGELQERSILLVLSLLEQRGDLTKQAVDELTAAYDFLRRTEHRLQMAADQQTHLLPVEVTEQMRLAYAMGFDDWSSFEENLRGHMRKVHGHFQQVFIAPQGESAVDEANELAMLWTGSLEGDAARIALKDIGYSKPDGISNLLRGLREGSSYRTFSAVGRERMDKLVPLLLSASALTTEPEETFARLTRLLEAIGRRSAYLSLLVENPLALSQLVKLFSASAWIASWISQHPIVMDELINPAILYERESADSMAADLDRQLAAQDPEDLESQMESLREFRSGRVLRVAAADVGPGLDSEQIGGQLCIIAELIVQHCLQLAADALVRRYGYPECGQEDGEEIDFAAIAYGKLGSLELGYTSDLDMIFLYGDCPAGGETTGERTVPNETFFARLGQRMIHMITTRTPAGTLYEVDMRLRPSGKSGPLVASLAAFIRYQTEHAWVWEHQALVRARPVAGSKALCEQFQKARKEILCQQRNEKDLRIAVSEMRSKMRQEHETRNTALVNVKHGPGGIVDIEFMVQYWVLRWAHEHPGLTNYTDNRRLLEALAKEGLLDQDRANTLIDAYRHYLSTEYRLKLMEQGAFVDPQVLGDYPEKVRAIWNDTFER